MTERKPSTLHKRLIIEAAERCGHTTSQLHGNANLVIRSAEGRVVAEARFSARGQLLSAKASGTYYAPDYRTHAYTSTPRQVLDRFIARELRPESHDSESTQQ